MAKKKATSKVKKKLVKKPAKKKSLKIDDSNFVFDNIDIPLILLDNKARIRRVNETWMEIFGDGIIGDYTGKSYLEFLDTLEKQKIYSTEIKNKIQSILEKAMVGNYRPKFLEFPIGGGWFLSHMHPVHTGKILDGFIITLHDVSVWKQKEMALKKESQETFENSERKMFFLANLNHELKSPLNSIMGFTQILKEQVLQNPHLEGYVGMIDNIAEAASHLNSIVFRILNMAKIESGTLTLQEERVMPARLIQLSLNIIQPMFPNRVIKVEVCKHAAIETLKCDKNLAMEVLINLMVNSLKFSQESIKVNCTVDDNKNLVFNVSDDGIGMTDQEVRVALEPFGQNIRSPNDKNTGLGLGVPFCNQVMKLHGGDLKILSEKGKGTTVTAVFPSNRILI